MQKYEYYTKFSYINEKQLQIYCCALALGMDEFPKAMLYFPTLKTRKQLLQRNLTFLSRPEVRTLANILLETIKNLLEYKSKSTAESISNFLDFYLLENYLLKFRYFYLTYRCQEILEDNRHINLMSDSLSDINCAAVMVLNLFSEAD